MSEDDVPAADRKSPVGRPVVRGDPDLMGPRAQRAVQFDPDDPESLDRAARVVHAFATENAGAADNVYMLRGAAACAALVRGEGSYKAAAERAGEGVTVAFIRKWARVHDLPRMVRECVATGRIAPTAAKHIARVRGEARYHLAWAVLDHGLTVRDVRSVASAINDGQSVETALAAQDVAVGDITLSLDAESYRDLRWRAARRGVDPEDVVADALAELDPLEE
ncbi:DUF7119 family protein [Halomarina rubra]|uniref:DUF7119 domain-containing protein n=1 Tax=Halomarina rubra TaxID=2071873 RepID=A0ABD6AU30_9EURY|nr:hypothetical protein [Halomarina rubra]